MFSLFQFSPLCLYFIKAFLNSYIKLEIFFFFACNNFHSSIKKRDQKILVTKGTQLC